MTRGTVRPEDARRSNRSALLRTLHRGEALSRAQLAKLTGLTPATVSSVFRDLIAEELVTERGRQEINGVGKPGTIVAIEPNGRHVLCLDLSEHDRFSGALVDLTGHVVTRRVLPRGEATGAGAVELAIRLGHELVAEAKRPILGVGVASPGIVDADGVVVTAAHLGWAGVELGARLTAALGVPAHVVNDANAAALGELTFGAETGDHLMLVRIDEGVGAGIVLNGELLLGEQFAAGEIGHVVIDPDGAWCACGKRGCLETEVSEPLLENRLAGATGDERSAILARAGERLGTALATILSALNLTDVVISGPEVVTDRAFREAALGAIAERTMPTIAERIVIRPSTLGVDDVLVGAAAVVLSRELGIA